MKKTFVVAAAVAATAAAAAAKNAKMFINIQILFAAVALAPALYELLVFKVSFTRLAMFVNSRLDS